MNRLWHIDDNPDDRFLVHSLIQMLEPDMEIIEFPYARQAMEVLEKDVRAYPDLVLLDLNMPDITGHEFLRMLRERIGIPFPIVVLSSTESQQERDESLKLGACGVVQKPYDLGEYKQLLQQIVEKYTV